ncbi:MAG: LemA family protein [Bdellovibrionales bacterium]|nr:LemA family protein [Bdellovibrionales bacterium]
MTGIIVVLVIVAGVLFYCVGIYNNLVRLKVATENAWSQIDVQLKRRYDLIPNLVETVKGYAKHEQETLEKVIQARNSAMSAQQSGDLQSLASAENQLSGTLRQLFALSESYPDLKANENFLSLQEELTTTENKVSFSRQHYNDSVGLYNTAIQQVPNNFIAGFGAMTPKQFFQLDAAEAQAVKQAPKVSFS